MYLRSKFISLKLAIKQSLSSDLRWLDDDSPGAGLEETLAYGTKVYAPLACKLQAARH